MKQILAGRNKSHRLAFSVRVPVSFSVSAPQAKSSISRCTQLLVWRPPRGKGIKGWEKGRLFPAVEPGRSVFRGCASQREGVLFAGGTYQEVISTSCKNAL